MSSIHLMDDEDNTVASKRMFTAVIARAICDVAGNDKAIALQARIWITKPFNPYKLRYRSFAWYCQQIDVDPNRIIRELPKTILEIQSHDKIGQRSVPTVAMFDSVHNQDAHVEYGLVYYSKNNHNRD